jgi:hypothetical protein
VDVVNNIDTPIYYLVWVVPTCRIIAIIRNTCKKLNGSVIVKVG